MNNLKKSADYSTLDSSKIIAAGAVVLAMATGAGVITVGANSSSQTIAVAAGLSMLIGAVVWTLLDLPVLVFVRLAFIASFFIKLEISLFKIDEVEDPSGFNISLAVICGAILLAHDFITRETDEKRRFPLIFAFLIAALFFCAALSVFYSGVGMLGYFSLWTLAGSILIVCALASHFSRRERIKELILGIAAGLTFTGAIAVSQFVLDFPANLSVFGTGTEDELIGTQAQILSHVQAFLRTPTEMGWVISALLLLVIAPRICRVREFGVYRKTVFAVAAFSGTSAVILSRAAAGSVCWRHWRFCSRSAGGVCRPKNAGNIF